MRNHTGEMAQPVKPGNVTTGNTPQGEPGTDNTGAEFGTSDRATRGTDRDLDRSDTSTNHGHGHPRGERGTNAD